MNQPYTNRRLLPRRPMSEDERNTIKTAWAVGAGLQDGMTPGVYIQQGRIEELRQLIKEAMGGYVPVGG